LARIAVKSYTVGLTGGIGSGKSTVAKLFENLGASVIDTDLIAHGLTATGGPAIASIRKKFGLGFIAPDGSLDRLAMRNLVFSDSTARAKLEAILHPLIRERVARDLRANVAPYVLLVVPLLIETGAYKELIDRILVVDCPEDTQIRRTMQRGRLSEGEVRAIMAAQTSRKSNGWTGCIVRSPSASASR
jgi:dephospho-CoA kinase